jgi:helix-turn-helix protein
MSERFARIPARVAALRHFTARDLRVLIAIAAHADPDGRAFPSLARIAALAAVDRTKVPPSIKKLTAAGLLTCKRRRDEAGDAASTVYQIIFEESGVFPTVGTPVPNAGTTGVPDGGNTVLPLVGTRGVPNGGTLTDHLFNRPLNTHSARNKRAVRQREIQPGEDVQFETFWRAYPSRGAQANPKKPAREKFAAAVKSGADPEVLIRAAANYAEAMLRAGTPGRFIKTAEVWLNKASWEQYADPAEPEPLRAGMI